MGVAFILSLFGFATLATGMRRHYRDLFGVDASRQKRLLLHAVGVLGLAASYAHLCLAWGAVEGSIDWLCLASLTAILVVVVLSVATSLRTTGSRDGVPR